MCVCVCVCYMVCKSNSTDRATKLTSWVQQQSLHVCILTSYQYKFLSVPYETDMLFH